jgi:uncharacterized protein (DUF2345 family)
MWGIPELGSSVVTACIDQDLRKRIWWAVIFDQQETNTILTGRFTWNPDGSVEGPLTSQGLPLEPLYSNFKTAFTNKTNSPEWKTRAATYQAAAVNKNLNQLPTPNEDASLDQQTDDIRNNTDFAWDKNRMGSHGYDQSGFAEMPFKASKAFGFSSPGGHTILMDDKPYNCRTQITSVHGHSILLDDTNERINIRTANGAAWFEMDYSGNIDVYAKKRFSVHAEDDINFFSDKTVRIQGTEGVFIYAGTDNGLEKIASALPSGDVRIQAQNDIHLLSTNLRQMSFQDTIVEVGNNFCITVGNNFNTQVEHDINLITNTGDYNTGITGDYSMTVSGKTNIFSVDEYWIASKSDVNMYSYEGTMNIASWENLVLKSMGGDVVIQSVGGSSGSGSVILKSPNTQFGVSETSAVISTTGTLNIQAGGNINIASNSPTDGGNNTFSISQDKNSFENVMGVDNVLTLVQCNPLAPSLSFDGGGIFLQATNDIQLISTSLGMSLPTLGGLGSLLGKITQNSLHLDTLAFYVNTAIGTISTAIGALAAAESVASNILSEIAGYVGYIEQATQIAESLSNINIPLDASFQAVLPLISTGLEVNLDCVVALSIPSISGPALAVFNNSRINL